MTQEEKEIRRLNEQKLREYHKPTLDKLQVDINKVYLTGKIVGKYQGRDDIVVRFFPSELEKKQDIFIEATSRDLTPEDPKRTLYHWAFNPFYSEELELTEKNEHGFQWYLIPISEFKIVSKKEEPEFNFDDIPDPNEDLPFTQLTIRDFIAIIKGKPCSRKKWINELVVDNKLKTKK